MATKAQTPDTQAPEARAPGAQTNQTELFAVEELRKEEQVSAAVFNGCCAAMGWRPGRRVTRPEFQAALKKFLGSPMGGTSKLSKESEAKK